MWQDAGLNVGEQDIYVQRYTANGTSLGSKVRVNTFLAGDQTAPTVAMDDMGNFVVVWDTTIPLATGHVVYGRRFAADATPLDAEQFPVDMQPRNAATQPSVAMDADGDFAVAWQGDDSIFAMRFDGEADPAGARLRISHESPSEKHSLPSIAMDAAGNFVVVWNSIDGDSSWTSARRYTSAGVEGNEFRPSPVGSVLHDRPRVAMNRGGEFAIVWQSSAAVAAETYAQRYDGSGRPISGSFQIGSELPRNSWAIYPAAGDGLVDIQQIESFQRISIEPFAEESENDIAIIYDGQRFDSQAFGVSPSFTVELHNIGASHVGIAPLIRQNGKTYLAAGRLENLDPMPRTRLRFEAISAAEFIEVRNGVTPRYDENSHPDFGGGAAPIEVGYLVKAPALTSAMIDVYDFRASSSSADGRPLPVAAIDDHGNLVVVWADASGTEADRIRTSWFDRSGNVLTDELHTLNLSRGLSAQPSVAVAPDGEFIIAWTEESAGGAAVIAQRFTLAPPTVLSASVGVNATSFVVAFSQEMAISGAGSVLAPANWALRLADGRYLTQVNPQTGGTDPRATPEQFGTITFAFNATSSRWEATLPLNFTLPPGDYQLIARGSLQDAAGRRLDGNGVPSASHAIALTVRLAGDYDLDSDVDGNDFLAWQRGLGSSAAVGSSADGNLDGVVDASDLAVWGNHFGQSVPAVATDAAIASSSNAAVNANAFSNRAAIDAVYAAGDFTSLFNYPTSFRPTRRSRQTV